MKKEIEKTYNELTIKKIIDRPNGETKYKSWGNVWAECKCSCGETTFAPLYGVTHGYIKSCGHIRKNMAVELLTKAHKGKPALNARYITYKGKTKNISEWSKETGISRTTILNRLNKNLPIEKVLEKTEHITKKHRKRV